MIWNVILFSLWMLGVVGLLVLLAPPSRAIDLAKSFVRWIKERR